jgi:O-antigen/teichoic acid export membrane protein
MLVFVWTGTGIWSLVAGLLALHATKAVGFNLARGWVSPLFDLRGSSGLLKYGATVTSDRVLSFMYQQSDKIVVGRMLGDMLLGTYNIAQTLGMIPLEKVLPIITQVSFASYARIQGDLDRVRRNLLRSTRAVALVAFPLFFGMSAVAPLGIPIILGAKWQSAIVPFQLLCLGMPFRALGPLLGAALHGIGRPDLSLRNMASLTVALTIAFIVAARFGLIAVCLTWLTVYPIVLLITIWLSLRQIQLPLPEYLAQIRFPIFGATLMLGTIKLLERGLATSRPGATLTLTIALGVAVYGSLIFMFKRQEFEDIRSLIGR